MSDTKIARLDRVSLWIKDTQEVIARLSALFLMLSLVTATWNLLVNGALFNALPWLMWVWGLAQAIAVDSKLAVIFVQAATAIRNKEWVRTVTYSITGVLLFLVAVAIVDVESLRQALNLALSVSARLLPFNITIEFLTQVRSVVVGLLIAVSGFELVIKPAVTAIISTAPEVVEPVAPIVPKASIKKTSQRKTNGHGDLIADFYLLQPSATNAQVHEATGKSLSTIARWKREHKDEQYTDVAKPVGSSAE